MGYWWDKGTLVDQYLMGSLMRMTMKHGGCWTWWSWHMIYHKRFCPYKLGVHNINYQKYGMNRLVRDALFFMVYTYWWCRDEDCVEFALYIIRIMCCACSKALSLSLSLSLSFFLEDNFSLIIIWGWYIFQLQKYLGMWWDLCVFRCVFTCATFYDNSWYFCDWKMY